MPYLIDGNNLMPHVRAATRRELLEKVSQFAQAERVKISVVFDGAEEQSFPDGARFKGVNVFYSQRFRDADARIKNFIEAAKEKRNLIVVTSDNALANFCRFRGAKIIRAPEFRRKLEAAEINQIELNRQRGVKNDDISDWLRYFGIDNPEEP
jgi:predicted RNA-binding protein with PIN domain